MTDSFCHLTIRTHAMLRDGRNPTRPRPAATCRVTRPAGHPAPPRPRHARRVPWPRAPSAMSFTSVAAWLVSMRPCPVFCDMGDIFPSPTVFSHMEACP